MSDDDDFGEAPLPSLQVREIDEDDVEYYEVDIPTANLIEEPDDFYETKREHVLQADEALRAEMKRADEKDEAKRADGPSVVAVSATKRRRAQSTTPRKRATKSTSSTTTANMSKTQKMRAKQMRTVMRDAEKIIASTVNDGETDDVRKLRVEAQHSYQQALAATRELKQLVSAATLTRDALKQHSEATAKLLKLLELQGAEQQSVVAVVGMHDMLFESIIETQASQTSAITKLHERVNKLVALYSNVAAKCEAVTRRHFDASAQYAPKMATDAHAQKQQHRVDDADRSAVVSATSSSQLAAAPAPQQPPAANGGAPLFSLRTGNGVYDLVTRPAPQIVRGRPGSHLMSFSIARRKGSAQQYSQSDTISRLHSVQRWKLLAEKKKAYEQFIMPMAHLNGEDDMKALEASKATAAAIEAGGSLALLENGSAKKRGPKRIKSAAAAAADTNSQSVAKKKK